MGKVLIGCEQSGIVRDAFVALGHDAYSCDLLPAVKPSNRHIIGDVRDVMMYEEWDLLFVAHPPCTRLANAGARWLIKPPKKLEATHYTDLQREQFEVMNEERRLAFMWAELEKGAKLFSDLWNVPHIKRVAIENPVMHKHAKARIRNFQPASQTVQPWQFATTDDSPDNEKKRTCLWLRNLELLIPTGTLDGSTARDSVHKAAPGPDRWKERSTFFPGIAAAMAKQWGDELPPPELPIAA